MIQELSSAELQDHWTINIKDWTERRPFYLTNKYETLKNLRVAGFGGNLPLYFVSELLYIL